MKLKRKIFNIFAAIVMIFGSTPSVFLSAYAAEPAGDAPKSLKTVKSNNDGTYDITLEIEGVSSEQTDITKANVVVVFDSSGSMDDPAGQSTRLQVAKNAVNNLASQLLSKNDPSDDDLKDMVEMTFIDFATNVKTSTTHTAPTTDLSTFQSWVNATSADGGTNWEAALNAANNVSFGDSDKTYIIFVSDGNPTFRDSRLGAGYYDDDGCRREYRTYGGGCMVWGSGNSDPYPYRNFNAAKAVADTIVADANKELYAVGAFGNADNMANIGGTYYNAADQAALETAFAKIVDKITTGLSVADLQITDGITAATSTEVDGTAGNFRYSVPESWGSDWNGATFDGGSVHWNPGHDKTLTNGEKASVTFTVWPSQEAMNCIAAIRNDGREACAEADLTKFGIGENDDGSFRLITNSTATFKYRTATKVNDEITYSALSGDVDFDEKRDPTNLPETTLSVVKSWLDSMDADQRKDISEVSVDLYVDRTSESTPERHYTFEAGEGGNEWIGKDGNNKSEYTVAPGVMKKLDGTPATEGLRGLGPVVMVGSDEYVVLEPGHDYEFDNEIVTLSGENGSNHYHITKRKYHPMIIGEGGNIHDVIFSDDGKTAVIDDNLLTKMSLENTLNGGILVGKDVINNGEKDTTITDEYEIKITLTGAEADSGQYRIYTYNEDGTVAGRSDKIDYAGGVITEKIKVNQKIMVTDVPTGTTFDVSEQLPDGYTRNEVKYELVKYDGTANEQGVHEVFGNASSTATVTNYLDSGDLKISKEVTATSGLLDKAQEKTFDFTVNFYENQGDSTPVRTDTETCKAVAHNGSCEFENIPAGWYYEIIEAAKPGFNGGEETVKTGTIKAGEETKVDFENKYAVTPVNTDITILKDFGNFWQNGDEFTFVMTDKDGNETTQTVGFSNHTAVFNVEIPDDGVYEYTVSEVETNGDGESVFRPGVSRLEGDQNIVVRIEAKDKEDGTLEIVSVTYSKESQTIYNTYKSTDVSASKIWDDEEDRDGLRENYTEDYFVAVKDNTGKFVAYEKLQTVDSEYSFVGLPATDTRGRTIEYEIAEAKNCSGEGDEIVCTEFTGDNDYAVTISGDTITNKHIPEMYDETGELTVKKLWAGEGNELVRPGSISVELLADGEVIDKVDIVAGQNNEWTYTFTGLYKNNDGKEISYSVQESKIGETAFEEGKSIIIVYDGERIAGKWEKDVSGYEVTNTWTESTSVYEGEEEFYLEKIDEDGNPMEGVKFEMAGEEYVTDEEGKIKIPVPLSNELPDEEVEFVISETETHDGYDKAEGSAVVSLTCDSTLASVDEEALKNTYTKSCIYDKTGSEEYVWNSETKTIVLTNNRSQADSLRIRKVVSGVDREKLEANGLIFALTGPDDFVAQEIEFAKFIEVEDGVYEYVVEGRIPTGEYTVKEGNAEVYNYTLTVGGDDGESKDVERGDEAIFEIENAYAIIDPCLEGGCGSIDTTPSAPETGRLTNLNRNGKDALQDNSMVAAVVTGTLFLLTSMTSVAVVRRRK